MNALYLKVLVGLFFMLTGTIFNCSAQLSCLTVNDIAVTEPDNGGGSASFKISLSTPSTQEVTVYYSTSNGTASSRNDYTAASGYLTFQPGETTKFLFLSIAGDLHDEYDETFYLNLSNATNATICDNKGTATILDNDAPPTMTISNMAVREQDSGTVKVKFLIQLSNWSYKDITFDYATINGTATAGSDYQASSGTFTIPAAHIRSEIVVTSYGDTTKESNETFTVNYSNPVNVQLTNTSSSATISNDDLQYPVISIKPYQQNVSESTDSVVFDLKLTRKGSIPLSVKVSTPYSSLSSEVEAKPNIDFFPLDTTITFLPGELVKPVKLAIIDNAVDNIDKRILVWLSSPQNVILDGYQTSEVWIKDDEEAVTISVPDSIIVSEGGAAVLNFTLSSPVNVTFDYSTEDGTAVNGLDYSAKQGPLTFYWYSPTTYPLYFFTTNDEVFDGKEYFYINLSTPSDPNVILTNNRIKVIVNEATRPTASFTEPSVIEGGAGDTTDLIIQVKLNFPSPNKSKFIYRVFGDIEDHYDFTAGPIARPGVEYISKIDSVVFMPGDTVKNIIVKVLGDDMKDGSDIENVLIKYISVENVIVPGYYPVNSPFIALGKIIDDDDLPTISIDSISVVEGNSGTTNAVFTLNLNHPNEDQVYVDARLIDVSASKASDYNDLNVSYVSFEKEATSSQLIVQIKGDILAELNETFKIVLSNPQNGILSTDSIGLGTIINDDAVSLPIIGVETESVNESTGILNFKVKLNEPAQQSISVNYTTADSTALATHDYTAASGVLNFAIGDSVKTISITLIDDDQWEVDNVFNLKLSNPINAAFGTRQAMGTILNDDEPRYNSTVIISDGFLYSNGTYNFIVKLVFPNNHTVTVDYSTADGTAAAGSDYSPASGTLTFLPGQTEKTISITPVAPTSGEGDEYFYVNLSNPVYGVFVDSVGIAAIRNNSFLKPYLSFNNLWYMVNEGDESDTTDMVMTLSLSDPSSLPVIMEYTTVFNRDDFRAFFDDDYIPSINERITFAPGETSKNIIIKVIGDNSEEIDEEFKLYPTLVINATLSFDYVNGQILNDDGSSLRASSLYSVENSKSSAKITNVFTPNGDGINDLFVIPNLETSVNELLVFNKQGMQVYKRSNYQNDWDGQGCTDGTYFYSLKLQKASGEYEVKKGYITLIRSRR
ncbi:hypothetical protein C3K47_16205 [Solitalea longa]|uniref:Calx-beta domain-containing protein n=1 Tax=Solitalea longa TaxID=2079460 RepID=A0A2S4ZYG7_9SPHI|nr:Calx-beta domain-containing protein [Solitalea longa]POY35326.1 hypothetical protein C3K47_16205 [Solitalea longa]